MGTNIKAIIGLVLALAATAAAADPLDGPRGAKILVDARAACDGPAWDRIAGWHERARISLPGHPEGAYDEWSAIMSLAMAMRTEPGGYPISYIGTDGTTSWRVLPGGGVDIGPPSGPSRLHLRDAYLSNFAYFLPARFRAQVVAAVYDVVSVRPAGAEDFDLWMDGASHRVARIVVGNQVAELRNYRTVSGVCAPTMLIQTDYNPAHAATIEVDSVDTAAVPKSAFAPPK